MKKKIFVTSNGCPGRVLDSSRISRYFELNNCEIIYSPQKADYILFVTCSFEKLREDECFRRIKEYQKYKGELIIAGCLPEIVPDKFKENFKGRYISTKHLENFDQLFPEFQVKFAQIPDMYILRHLPLAQRLERLYNEFEFSKNFSTKIKYIFSTVRNFAYFRICGGCIENCAYCSIRKAVGPLKSKPIELLQKDYQQLLESGKRKFTMYADNVGAYGRDCGSSLAELLEALSSVDEKYEVEWFIDRLHPKYVVQFREALTKRIKAKKISKILCPIQSGNERILRSMNRDVSTDELLDCFKEFKSALPDLKLFTHMIVGFPSETHEEFLESLEFIKKVPFNLVFPFIYHDLPGTMAAKFEQKIPEHTLKNRMDTALQFFDNNGIDRILF